MVGCCDFAVFYRKTNLPVHTPTIPFVLSHSHSNIHCNKVPWPVQPSTWQVKRNTTHLYMTLFKFQSIGTDSWHSCIKLPWVGDTAAVLRQLRAFRGWNTQQGTKGTSLFVFFTRLHRPLSDLSVLIYSASLSLTAARWTLSAGPEGWWHANHNGGHGYKLICWMVEALGQSLSFSMQITSKWSLTAEFFYTEVGTHIHMMQALNHRCMMGLGHFMLVLCLFSHHSMFTLN